MRISPCLVGIPISPHLISVNISLKNDGLIVLAHGWKDTMEFATPYDLVNAACSTEVPKPETSKRNVETKRRLDGCLGRKQTS